MADVQFTRLSQVLDEVSGTALKHRPDRSRRGRATPPSLVAILTERLDHNLEVSVYDRQQNAGRPVGNPSTSLKP